jgi:putative ABC transport system permease protein
MYEGEPYLDGVTPIPLAPAIQENFGEVEATTRVYSFNTMVQKQENKLSENVHMVDSSFFKLFDFKLVTGNNSTPLENTNSLVVTETLAKKYFGNISPVGKTMQLQVGDQYESFNITAVAKDPPVESSIRFSMLIPFSNARKIFSENAMTSWGNVYAETYLLLKKGITAESMRNKLPAIAKKAFGNKSKEDRFVINLQPITDMHLNTSVPVGIEPISNPKYSYILGTIGILILLIACINFVTLSIGRSTTRALEVGVRKVLGAERRQLIRQFWGEAVLLTFVSLITAIILAMILLPSFNTISNKTLTLSFDLVFISYCFGLLVLIGLLAGIYPAFILSGFTPIQVLKGRIKAAANIGLLRRSLIVGQFVASIVMIVSTLMISRQLNYLRSKDLGYNKESIVVIPTNKSRLEGNQLAELYKEQLAKETQVKAISTSLYSLNEPGWISMDYKDNNKVRRAFRMNAIDAQFIPALGIQVVAGRAFSPDNPADSANSMIVNETLIKDYGWKPEEAIGKRLPGKFEQTIIGVVKDFNYESLHTPVKPLMLVMKPDSVFKRIDNVMFDAAPQPRITVRLQPGNLESQLAMLKANWKAIAGDQDFEYRFLDDSLNTMYREEQRLSTIVKYASGLSIFVACMGLFGLATLVVTRRTKEIGIRKVLGADVSNIVGLLSKEFLIMVGIAALVSFPIAWFALHKWLEDFAYRISISWWVFVVAGLVALVIALLTVSFQAIKAAIANPVKSLRSE